MEIGVAPGEINLFIHGTTLAKTVNAITIERKGAVTVTHCHRGLSRYPRYLPMKCSLLTKYDIFIDKARSLWSRASAASLCPERIDATEHRAPPPRRGGFARTTASELDLALAQQA